MCVSMDRLILLLSSTPSLSLDLTGPLFAVVDVCVDGQAHSSVIFDSLSESRLDLLSVCCNRCVCRWTGLFFCYLRLPL